MHFIFILLVALDHKFVAHLVLDKFSELFLLFGEPQLRLVGLLLHGFHFLEGLLLAMSLVVFLGAVDLLCLAFLKDADCVKHVQAVVDATAQILLLIGLLFFAVGAGAGAVEKLGVIFIEL